MVFNTGGGGLDLMQEASIGIRPRPAVGHSSVLPDMIANMASCQISLNLGTHGP